MKKTALILALVMILMLTVAACGKKPAANTGTTTGGNAPASSGSTSASGTDAAQTNDKNDEVTFGIEGESVVFTASMDFKLEDSTAWLGIIPTGTKYEKEADADEVDMIYCYVGYYEEENKKSYRFEYEKEYFFGLGDGTYDMVLTSSDDGAIGKVLLQIGIEIKGEKITLDFDNKK